LFQISYSPPFKEVLLFTPSFDLPYENGYPQRRKRKEANYILGMISDNLNELLEL